jgi:hypothetical protein
VTGWRGEVEGGEPIPRPTGGRAAARWSGDGEWRRWPKVCNGCTLRYERGGEGGGGLWGEVRCGRGRLL